LRRRNQFRDHFGNRSAQFGIADFIEMFPSQLSALLWRGVVPSLVRTNRDDELDKRIISFTTR
jgi:hypothetical protein